MKPPAIATEKVPLITKFAFGAGDVGPAIATAIIVALILAAIMGHHLVSLGVQP